MPRGQDMEAIFTLLNATALTGWSAILCLLLLQSTDSLANVTSQPIFHAGQSSSDDTTTPLIIYALLFLEAICFVEVGRIALGQLKGNLILGVVLHVIRMTCLFLVLTGGLLSFGDDKGDDGSFVSQFSLSMAVLYSWALTEVGRYPMYLFPTSSAARYVRLVLPLVTFPLGAAAEAWGAYNVLSDVLKGSDDATTVYWAKVGVLGLVVLINGLLGPTMAYPALLKKGVPVLMGRPEKKRKTTKKA